MGPIDQNTATMIIAIGLGIIFILALFIGGKLGKRKLRKQIRARWGNAPFVNPIDSEKSLRQAWQYAKNFRHYDSEIDDITWYDLDMFALFEALNATYSSVGSEALYQRLRNFDFRDKEAKELEDLIKFYEENPKIREKIQIAFAELGKVEFNQAKEYLALEETTAIKGFYLHVCLGLLPIVGFVIGMLGFMGGFILTLLVFLFNVIYYVRKKELLNRQLRSLSYVVRTLGLAVRLSKLDLPCKEALEKRLKPLRKTLYFGTSFRVKTTSELEFLIDFINMIFMLSFIAYNFILKQLAKHNQAAIQLWEIVGDLEVAYAVLNFRIQMGSSCLPTFQKGGLVAQNSFHPLLEKPVKNPVFWEKNTIITGSNASGKSTYVKSVAINCILAQTIHTALADSLTMERGHVLSSMAVKDDLFVGDSYFVSEIRSLYRILQQLQTGERCYCFIDEILRGTNTVERIAASSNVIRWMTSFNSLVLVATHDIELPEILSNHCENIHFEEQVVEGEVRFDYLLKDGVAKTRNAILLLQTMDFPQEIVTQAQAGAEYFERNRSWQVFDTE